MRAVFTSLILLTLLFSVSLSAQPVINSNWINVGSGALISSIDASTVPDPGPAGENVTWDFGDLMPADTAVQIYLQYGLPDTTPYAADYPEANIVQTEAGTEFYDYWKLTSDSMVNYGLAAESIQVIYTDPIKLVEFPFTYQSAFADSYNGTAEILIAGLTGYTSGNLTATADGYGTLILPDGTYDNVLRLHQVTNSRDSVDIGFGLTTIGVTTIDAYTWVSPGYPGSLASRSTVSTYTIGLLSGVDPDTSATETTEVFSYDPSAVISGLKPIELVNAALITPNPVVDQVNLTFESGTDAAFDVTITALDGKLLHSDSIRVTQGRNRVEFQAPGSKGYYLLTLRNASGYQSFPFLVQ